MSEQTYSALFAGGDLAGEGLKAAGYRPLDLVEMDPAIAEVAMVNNPGTVVHVCSVLDADYRLWERPTLLWASPPCPNFSRAKRDAAETDLDLALAGAICAALRALLPPTFVLENVRGYLRSRSLSIVRETLDELGYWHRCDVLDAADFGVPQNRHRLYVRAVRGALVPQLPAPVPWIGWYAAIADIVDTLPESQFAPWQLARLDKSLGDKNFLVAGNSNEAAYGTNVREDGKPSLAVTTGAQGRMRAFLVGVNGEGGDLARGEIAPSPTLSASHSAGKIRAFIVHPHDMRSMPVRAADEPLWTITAGSNSYRQPTNKPRAWLSEGRVVAMTPRALARFQSVPDSYILPDAKGLAAKIIGNGVASLVAQRIAEAFGGIE